MECLSGTEWLNSKVEGGQPVALAGLVPRPNERLPTRRPERGSASHRSANTSIAPAATPTNAAANAPAQANARTVAPIRPSVAVSANAAIAVALCCSYTCTRTPESETTGRSCIATDGGGSKNSQDDNTNTHDTSK